jgi:hypothetical protein
MIAERILMDFFRSYGEVFNNGTKLSEFYGECAVASAPNFVGCLKGREEVHTALVEVAEYQVKTGMTSLTPLNIDTTDIDPLHCWAKVQWGARFKKTGDKQIEFAISYLLRRNKEKISILLYISHQDELQIRHELGLT